MINGSISLNFACFTVYIYIYINIKLYRLENYHKKKKIELGLYYALTETEVFCVRFDPDDNLVALGTLDGIVKVYNLQTSVLLCEISFLSIF